MSQGWVTTSAEPENQAVIVEDGFVLIGPHNYFFLTGGGMGAHLWSETDKASVVAAEVSGGIDITFRRISLAGNTQGAGFGRGLKVTGGVTSGAMVQLHPAVEHLDVEWVFSAVGQAGPHPTSCGVATYLASPVSAADQIRIDRLSSGRHTFANRGTWTSPMQVAVLTGWGNATGTFGGTVTIRLRGIFL